MPAKSKFAATLALFAALLFTGMPSQVPVAEAQGARGASPALCGPGDTLEPGLQGDVAAGATANYNCGVRLVGQLPLVGNVQGVGTCAYVRMRVGPGASGPGQGDVAVIDVSDPANPRQVGTIPTQAIGSETMRVAVNSERAVLVSGRSVYDIRDCLHPVLKGEIQWPTINAPRFLPHDLRINHAGTMVYAAMGVWTADISNLNDPSTWTVTDHRCELAEQVPGPWQQLHRAANAAHRSLCDDAAQAPPRGAGPNLGASGLQSSLIWPTLSHSPDLNGEDTRLYVGDQAGGSAALWSPVPKVRIIDVTQRPFRILGEVDGAGHGLDWFRVNGRDYVLHSNEGGTAGIAGQQAGDTCRPYPRPYGLGWGFDAVISDVTRPDRARHVSILRVAINDPENCEARRASGRDPFVAYHLIDNAANAHFAAVNFGSAGLRIFDIRNPAHPSEVAYFNHGAPVHAGVGYYDARRGLIYAAGSTGFWVLELEPQVRQRLGL